MSRISAAACLFFVASSAAFSVRADSQTGGVPSLDVRVSTLETTVGVLQTSLTTLQNTVTTLQAANNDLQKALNDEITARFVADAGHRGLGRLQFAEDATAVGEKRFSRRETLLPLR